MAASLEANKIVGAILTAGIIASASGNLARILYKPETLEEPVYRVEAAEATETVAAAEPEEALPFAALLAAADPDNGAKIAKKCIGCHSVNQGEKDKVGPNLWGIVGRPIAAREGYAYSDALKALDGDWTYERLDAFIADPKGFAPGTKMSFGGIKKAEDRADLVAWLRTLADEPLPLPEAEKAAVEEPAGAAPAGEQAAVPAEQAAAEPEQPPAASEQPPATPEKDAAQVEQPAAEESAAAANPVLAMLASADPEAGAKAARSCKACHSLEKGGPNKVGPPLWDIVGRPVAAVEGYAYSAALKNMGGVWTYERLEAFIRKPREAAPGTKMSFGGVRREQDRANLLAFLRSLSDDPKPLP